MLPFIIRRFSMPYICTLLKVLPLSIYALTTQDFIYFICFNALEEQENVIIAHVLIIAGQKQHVTRFI